MCWLMKLRGYIPLVAQCVKLTQINERDWNTLWMGEKKKLIYCWKIALDFRSLAKKSNLPKPNASEIKARYIIFIPVYAFLEAELRLTRILLNIYTEQWQCSGFHKCTAVDHLHTIKTPFFAMKCETEKNFPCFHRGHAIPFQTEGKYSILFTIIIWSSCGHSTGHRIYRKWKQLGHNSLSLSCVRCPIGLLSIFQSRRDVYNTYGHNFIVHS